MLSIFIHLLLLFLLFYNYFITLPLYIKNLVPFKLRFSFDFIICPHMIRNSNTQVCFYILICLQ